MTSRAWRVSAVAALIALVVCAAAPPAYRYGRWHHWHPRWHRGGGSFASLQNFGQRVEAPAGLQPANAYALRPGQFIWGGFMPVGGAMRIVVDLSTHHAFVYKGNTLIAVSTVSTGRRGHGTPTGTFPIIEKAMWHRSNIYSNAPMPFMQRLTMGGIALHAGRFSGGNQSHGCIRLPWTFAKLLFGVTTPGTEVDVVRSMNAIPPRMPAPVYAGMPSTQQAVDQMVALAI
jgi:hypothetical protein